MKVSTEIPKENAPRYTIGAYERCAEGRAGLGKFEVFGSLDEWLPLAERATSLAFDNACTGPGDCYRETGAKYEVREEGRCVFSIEVTVDGRTAFQRLVTEALAADHQQMRGWARTGYERTTTAPLVGDTQNVVRNILYPRITLGVHVFDGGNRLAESFKSLPDSDLSCQKIAPLLT